MLTHKPLTTVMPTTQRALIIGLQAIGVLLLVYLAILSAYTRVAEQRIESTSPLVSTVHHRVYDMHNIVDAVDVYNSNITRIHHLIDQHECRAYTPCNNCSDTTTLGAHFQHYLHDINYQPSDTARFFLDSPMEVRQFGTGAALLNRASGMMLAARTGRALMTYTYSDLWAYDYCSHRKGINGCAVRRWSNYSADGVPEHMQLAAEGAIDAEQFRKQHPYNSSTQQLLDYYQSMKYLSYKELDLWFSTLSYIPDTLDPPSKQNYIDVMQPHLQLGIEQSGIDAIQPYKRLPPFWWHSQSVRYMLQPLPHTAYDMLWAMGLSLQLDMNRILLSIEVFYATSLDVDMRWQVSTAHLLNQWRHMVLSRSSDGGVPYDTSAHPPSFIYVFMRTGDKATEVAVHGVKDYADLIESVYAATNITHVYIGADNYNAAIELRAMLHQRYTTYMSVLLIEFEEEIVAAKVAAEALNSTYEDPFGSGFVWRKAAGLNDRFKTDLHRRTILEYYISALADAHIGTHSSNHCRVAYALASAMQNKYTLPMLSLDQGDHNGRAVNLGDDKVRRMSQCVEQ